MPRSRPDAMDKIIGGNIRWMRINRGLSQAELGHVLHVTFQQIQKYERGRSRIAASDLGKISVTLRCDLSAFFQVNIAPRLDDQALSRSMREYINVTRS